MLVLAALVTAVTFWRLREALPVPVLSLAWLWLLWFLVAPYDHYYDYLFLAPVVLSYFAVPKRAQRIQAIGLLYAGVFLVHDQAACCAMR